MRRRSPSCLSQLSSSCKTQVCKELILNSFYLILKHRILTLLKLDQKGVLDHCTVLTVKKVICNIREPDQTGRPGMSLVRCEPVCLQLTRLQSNTEDMRLKTRCLATLRGTRPCSWRVRRLSKCLSQLLNIGRRIPRLFN